ncbi:MAG: peptidyl-prolyl cis-trans isomerase [Gammaproteobacteria bacterium]|nr:MAG: peptidyl-prolyl cis-trans isomerase [Gammaproteobacteria bacterium]RLA47889.1 MAG: peptidyl-prolyl cis-trans isomerase [Gammaproteobacteria bacterium]
MNRLLVSISLFASLLLTSAAWSSAAIGSQSPDIPTETRVKLSTNLGDIIIELYPEKAPLTVANFVGYVNSKYYEGTVFHRVIPEFMAQGGGFYKNLNKKPTLPPIQNEADNGLRNLRGTIAMARTNDPHSATGQFFINLADNRFLDHKNKSIQGWGYTVFGKVVDGMDVVYEIGRSPTGGRGPFPKDVPLRTITIKSAVVLK